uniref:Uncharacterized protein n=1 Tax=Thermogemmatispora argillosa TaxID=2045280 RepID=A0A455T5S7_9CHLR|nr:hypothetical protein KTA_29810 [Thermogemmatispora argillosa]
MQKTSLRMTKASPRPLQEAAAEIRHFSLRDLLPPHHLLALNLTLGTLAQLACEEGLPRLIAEQQFTNSEICVLLPLLEAYPHYCPYEVLLASFINGHITDAEVERCRRRLSLAQAEGVWDQEMRPVRNVLSRTRMKLYAFGIDIFSILETGYVLMRRTRQRPSSS